MELRVLLTEPTGIADFPFNDEGTPLVTVDSDGTITLVNEPILPAFPDTYPIDLNEIDSLLADLNLGKK